MLAKDFKIRASKSYDIATDDGLTDNQLKTLKEYRDRDNEIGKPLTDNMKNVLADLEYKLANPQLPKGCKTYAKQWLKERMFKRRKEMSNKYTDKGNFNELDALDLVSRFFQEDMTPYYDTKYVSNDYSEGTCDINHPNLGVTDIKNSWSLDTFPMFETELPDLKYGDQINTYQDLYKNYKTGHVAYVLTDCPLHILEKELRFCETDDERQVKAVNLIFTNEGWFKAKEKLFPNAEPYEFIEIPRKQRIKVFNIEWDKNKVEKRKKRVEEIRKYIKELLNLQK